MNKLFITLLLTLSFSTITMADDTDTIRTTLRSHMPEFAACHTKAVDASTKPNALIGKVNFKFTLSPEGKVSKPQAISQDITDAKALDCMKTVLEGIAFKNLTLKTDAEVNQPMNFRSNKI